MYFASRLQAGRMLANDLVKKYRHETCAIIALSDGGVMVGVQIATQLHCIMTMLLTAEIVLPREFEAVAGITAEGTMSYNHRFTQGELSEMTSEYFNYIEQEKMMRMHDLNRLTGKDGLMDKALLRNHYLILVSDGMQTGFQLDLAAEYLKTISYKKLIVATPFASVQAVDRMHVLADEIYCPSVVENFISVDHYYDTQDVPDHKTVIHTIENILGGWK